MRGCTGIHYPSVVAAMKGHVVDGGDEARAIPAWSAVGRVRGRCHGVVGLRRCRWQTLIEVAGGGRGAPGTAPWLGLAGPQGEAHRWSDGCWWTAGVGGPTDVLLVAAAATFLSFVLVVGFATRVVIAAVTPTGVPTGGELGSGAREESRGCGDHGGITEAKLLKEQHGSYRNNGGKWCLQGDDGSDVGADRTPVDRRHVGPGSRKI